MPTPNSQHILIVGAGPGGLAASLLLAKAGVNVTVVERSKKVGGRTKVIERDGFKFDLGPTFFHYTEVIEEIFQAIRKGCPQGAQTQSTRSELSPHFWYKAVNLIVPAISM